MDGVEVFYASTVGQYMHVVVKWDKEGGLVMNKKKYAAMFTCSIILSCIIGCLNYGMARMRRERKEGYHGEA